MKNTAAYSSPQLKMFLAVSPYLFHTRIFSVDEANRLYQSTKAIANSSLAKATAARTEAFELFREAQEQLPSIDVEQLKREAQQIKDQVKLLTMGGSSPLSTRFLVGVVCVFFLSWNLEKSFFPVDEGEIKSLCFET